MSAKRNAKTSPLAGERAPDTGFFMCHHDTTEPPVERADQPAQVDMKQEAVLTVLREQRKRGDGGCLGCEETVNQDTGLAWRAYVRARINFYRARRGTGHRAVQVESIDERHLEVASGECEQEREAVESTAVVRRIVRQRVPELSDRQVQRVIIVMSEAQAIKGRKWVVMPDNLRAAISRLRKATGLPLDTSLL